MEEARQQRIVLHVDMDSFFASVEVRDNPSLAGRPVVVGADPQAGAGRGVVATCSYEAREYGIRSAMPISLAWQRCPHAVFLPVRHRRYTEVSQHVMAILRRHARGAFQQVGVDEAYLECSGCTYEEAEALGAAIRSDVRALEGITCSVGIAPNKTIAKIASDRNKPDGMTVVRPDEAAAFLAPLPVGTMPGVGKKSIPRLAEMGITTIGDLARADVQALQGSFGKWGVIMHERARGIDDRPVAPRGERKSIGREHTFGQDTSDRETIARTFEELLTDTIRSLRRHHALSRTVTVKVRYTGFVTKSRAQSLPRPTDDRETLGITGCALLDELLTGQPVRLVGVALSSLEPDGGGQTRIDDFV
ncbi:MAG TPA: DNA polymerase IV [Methanoculleus sp.]|nr:DNA polymerase IV [Methanoculleus sp.]